jgi:hypothetical protein
MSMQFRKWITDRLSQTVVTDASGKPLVVYHSTNEEFDKFKDRMTFFSDDKRWTQSWGETTWSAYLLIRNPIYVREQGMHFEYIGSMFGVDTDGNQVRLDKKVHDGVIIENAGSPTIYVVFRKSQIVPLGKEPRDPNFGKSIVPKR